MKRAFIIILFLLSYVTGKCDTSSVVLATSLEGYYHDFGTFKKTDYLVFTCSDSGLVINGELAFRKISGSKNKFIAIRNTDGRKMSKSFGNCIFINDSPEDVFGKAMSISDDLMKEWWPIISGTDFPVFDISAGDRSEDFHPMKLKKDLAWLITKEIWGHDKAREAQEHFENTIQSKKIPENIQSIVSSNIISAILQIRKCSVSEAKRLIKQGAVRVNDIKVEREQVEANSGDIVKVGKLDLAKVS